MTLPASCREPVHAARGGRSAAPEAAPHLRQPPAWPRPGGWRPRPPCWQEPQPRLRRSARQRLRPSPAGKSPGASRHGPLDPGERIGADGEQQTEGPSPGGTTGWVRGDCRRAGGHALFKRCLQGPAGGGTTELQPLSLKRAGKVCVRSRGENTPRESPTGSSG